MALPLVDEIVAGVVLCGTAGVVAVRAAIVWRDFSLQRRAENLMARGVELLEREINEPRLEPKSPPPRPRRRSPSEEGTAR
jgi:hypothetical protein